MSHREQDASLWITVQKEIGQYLFAIKMALLVMRAVRLFPSVFITTEVGEDVQSIFYAYFCSNPTEKAEFQ